ncbi:hypothetical protein QJS10_CPB18g01323 [Acorus calamus]|uniref:Uncharacterized protein n=1 Tax=Acorus calamus TaxID=4465 RepID=A0AAV9CJZ3_ACOCL|nr:hypothetical protein QJS10_CPB18g01323 [Acorus calamus]
MYVRRFKYRRQNLDLITGYLRRSRSPELVKSRLVERNSCNGGRRNIWSWALPSRGSLIVNNWLVPFRARNPCRYYSSEGDGRNASDGENVKDLIKTTCREAQADVRLCDEHARLGVLDQQDWIANERLFIEGKKKESPFLTRKERFKNDFLRRVVPWEKITVSLDSFPYHIDGEMKYRVQLTTQKDFTGTKLFRERLVRALAHDLQDFVQECASEIETDDENVEAETTSGSEGEDDNDASNEEDWTSSSEVKSDEDNDERVSAEAIKKLLPFSVEEFEKVWNNEMLFYTS